MDKGLFIIFEGLDGSGKSTQISLLTRYLEATGCQVQHTAEPTELPTGKLLREALGGAGNTDPAYLAGLFLADRVAHNTDPEQGIIQLLNQGISVISDRYYYSSFAYQGMDTDLDWVLDMNLNSPVVCKPDLCIFLDVDYRTCKERIDSRQGRLEIFEKDLETLARIRDKFFEVFRLLESTENIKIVNADRPPEEIAREIIEIVDQLMQKRTA